MSRSTSSRRGAAALLVALASSVAAAAPAGPEAEVREVVERYFRADALGSPEELKKTFGSGASVLEKRGSQWVRGTPDALAARLSGVRAGRVTTRAPGRVAPRKRCRGHGRALGRVPQGAAPGPAHAPSR